MAAGVASERASDPDGEGVVLHRHHARSVVPLRDPDVESFETPGEALAVAKPGPHAYLVDQAVVGRSGRSAQRKEQLAVGGEVDGAVVGCFRAVQRIQDAESV